MHVGHIRSTVIGNALAKILHFLGHEVITDNHLGDWGTQFGMIIYGYRHFLDASAYQENAVGELARLYRLVRRLVDYQQARESLPRLEEELSTQDEKVAIAEQEIGRFSDDAKKKKKAKKQLKRQKAATQSLRDQVAGLRAKIDGVDADPDLADLAGAHPAIATDVLLETAKLHAGDEENMELWKTFMPKCLGDIERIYRRLGIDFDHTLGESFYQPMLGPLVDDLIERGIAKESDGAICVFFPDREVPMLIRKKDGAFLYATTDLATLRYRLETFRADAILYVVDFRQSMHFEHLFEVANMLGYDDIELAHVKFGTVLGEDGRPFRTRAGDTVGLEGLLDEAESRALAIVEANESSKPSGGNLTVQERRETARRIGIAALIYADLSQNRESDYVFSYDKMLAMNGNTATYMQYAYARVRSIFSKGEIDIDSLRKEGSEILLTAPAERELAIFLLRFSEALENVTKDYRPNFLTSYLFDLANRYSTFYEECPVLKAENQEIRKSRLLLCDLTARTLALGLELLGIEPVERM
jgi:arginyl-tRNA synthetase